MPLTVTIRAAKPLETEGADLLVIASGRLGGKGDSGKGDKPGKADKGDKSKGSKGKGVRLGETLDAIDAALGGGLAGHFEKEEFTARRDQLLLIPTFGKLPFGRIMVLGLGSRGSFTDVEARSFSARAARTANAEKARTLLLSIPEGLESRIRAIGEGLELGAYRFTKYLTGDRKPKAELTTVTLLTAGKAGGSSARGELELGQKIAAGVLLSRDLSNEPPNVLTPAALATAAQIAARMHGFNCTVFDYAEIKHRGMLLIQAVGQGSVNEPRFVHMSYVPKQKPKKRLVFVGKGVTFDSGGISIKPAAGMGEMKHDMSGAGNMVGLMVSVAALKPKCEVHAIFAAVENMPDGNAYRPGDVWGSLDGKSVEIINTDAEGRLDLGRRVWPTRRKLDPDVIGRQRHAHRCDAWSLSARTCSGWFFATANRRFGRSRLRPRRPRARGSQFWRHTAAR